MYYQPKLSGSTTGAKTGRYYKYDAGKLIEAPEGEFDHLGKRMIKRGDVETAVVVESEQRDKPLNGTVKQIKKWLDDNQVDYDSTAKKAELLEILADA